MQNSGSVSPSRFLEEVPKSCQYFITDELVYIVENPNAMFGWRNLGYPDGYLQSRIWFEPQFAFRRLRNIHFKSTLVDHHDYWIVETALDHEVLVKEDNDRRIWP